MLSLYEVSFHYTPEDDTSGDGYVSVLASSENEVHALIYDMMGGAPNLTITAITFIAQVDSNVPHPAHPTLQ